MSIIAILCLVLVLEGLIHLFVQYIAKPYKLLLNSKSITYITNEVHFINWNEVQKIESRHNDVHFIDKLGRVQLIDTELIQEADKDQFIERVNTLAREKNIFCSIDCKTGYYHKENED